MPREPDPPSPHELAILLDHLRVADPTLYTFVIVGAMTGARRAQLLGLRWRDIDFARGKIAFCNGWVEGPNGPELTHTKPKRRHSVELDQTSVDALRNRADFYGAIDRDEFVFSERDGAAWKPNRVTKSFQRHITAAGLRPFRLHDLRHFMATKMLNAGVPIPIVSRRLDHRRVSTTLDFYSHSTPARDRFGADTLRGVLSGTT